MVRALQIVGLYLQVGYFTLLLPDLLPEMLSLLLILIDLSQQLLVVLPCFVQLSLEVLHLIPDLGTVKLFLEEHVESGRNILMACIQDL